MQLITTLALGLVTLRADPVPPAWLDVPFVQQAKAGCGAAAVAMIVQYWARQQPGLVPAEIVVETEQINKLLPPTSAKGIQGQALKAYLAERGFSVFLFNGELQDLVHHFEKGRPVVVCLALSGRRGPLHYAVVVGVDQNSVRLHDPARGKLVREEREHFLSAWEATGRWAMLAVPRQAQ